MYCYKNMKFLILKTTNPHVNLAIEEYFFSQTTDDIFMLWQNEPTIVIGKNQNAFAEINMEFVKANKIHIARRISGGGAVYHDLGNINYTFIRSKECSGGIDFEHFTKPIIESLKNFGISAKLSGRNDLVIDDKKFSGNAQHVYNNRVLHHGTLLFDTDLDVLSKALKVDPDKIKAKAIKSTRSRVTNLKPYFPKDTNADEFIKMISENVKKQFDIKVIDAPRCSEIDRLAERNASYEWLYPSKKFISGYTVNKKKKYEFGIVNLELDMLNETISDVRITGDFFGYKDVCELEEIIKNSDVDNLAEVLRNVNIHEYVCGMTNREFIDLIKE